MTSARRLRISDARDSDLDAAAVEDLQPLPSDAFDSIHVDGVAALALERDDVASQIQRVLRPGGALDIDGVPDRRALHRLSKHLAHYFEQTHAGTHHVLRFRRRRLGDAVSHFEDMAPEYWQELPAHVQHRYHERKIDFICSALGDRAGLVGLDIGCGVGEYANALAQRTGHRVIGIDPTNASARHAFERGRSSRSGRFAVGDALRLPLRTAAVDFAYAINMLHHLKRGEQERALDEVARVLKPGAPFLLLEINTRNPAFRWYMRKVFPKTRRIDRGDEEFIHPDRLPLNPRFVVERIEYATFVPDFVPKWVMTPATWLERALERTPARKHAIHYMALMRPQPVSRPPR